MNTRTLKGRFVMDKTLLKTMYPPVDQPMMVWDGHCGFCKYWVIRWKKMTGSSLQYETYQNISGRFPDIPREKFREAVRLIDTGGKVYSGAEAVYKALALGGRQWVYKAYQRSRLFRSASDAAYQWIANNRPFSYQVTKAFWGKEPTAITPYWLVYAVILLLAVVAWLF